MRRPPDRWHVTEDGCRLAVRDGGARNADRRLLVAHGAGSSAQFVLDAFDGVARTHGWALTAYDLRGHVDSSPAPDVGDHDIDVHAGDLASLAAAERPDVLGGISIGASAAAIVSARGVVDLSGLLLCMPAWTGTATAGEGPHAMIAARVAREGVAPMVADALADTSVRPWLRDVLARDLPAHDPASIVAVLTSLDGGRAAGAEDLAAIRVPTVVAGWPGDPGHPWEVATAWLRLLGTDRVGLARLTLDALDGDVGAFGRTVFGALVSLLPAA